ncbi:MAG: DinB family protein [Trueperaceae bacterium]
MDPFLSGDVPGSAPLVSAWLRGHQHLVENLERWTSGLPDEGWWWTPAAGVINPIGGLLRHIGGSSLRLWLYASGGEVGDELRSQGPHELEADGADPSEVLALCLERLAAVRDGLEAFDLGELDKVRYVGRKRVPVRSVLIVQHLLEHGHAHAGQVIVGRKLWDAWLWRR